MSLGIYLTLISGIAYASATCSLSLVGGDLNFLSKSEGETTGEDTLLLSNDGTETATINVSGTDWEENPGNIVRMNGDNTRVSISSGPYSGKTSIVPEFELINLKGGNNQLTFWQVFVNLATGSKFFTGAINQTVTVSFTC